MNYIIYIRNNCNVCKNVLNYLNTHGFKYKVVNLDNDNMNTPPINIFIVPALCNNSKLLAYGYEIIRYFETKVET